MRVRGSAYLTGSPVILLLKALKNRLQHAALMTVDRYVHQVGE